MSGKSRKRDLIPFVFLIIAGCIGLLPSIQSTHRIAGLSSQINLADTVWILTSTALVFIMTPGLALFYSGMVNKKNVISTMLQSFIALAVITILWMVVGFSVAFGESWGGIVGNPATFFMMKDVLSSAPWELAPTIPLLLFALFQLKFAIITPALITGAFSERIRFTSYVLFIVLFSLFIYAPLAHATWHPNGILFKLGVLDFAGGTVVHMSAGLAALVAAIFLKQRTHKEVEHKPARISYVLLGTGLLWFGWFGFNAGSAFSINNIAVNAVATTTTASAAAALAWIFFDVAFRHKKPSGLGLSVGAVVGLVAITPAAGFVSIPHSLIIGIFSSVVSNLMVEWRTKKTSIDDTLDVFPCHGIGGISGMILTGVFANSSINSAVVKQGLIFGEYELFFIHIIATIGVALFVIVGTWILLWVVNKISPLRVSVEDEIKGLDISQHDESL